MSEQALSELKSLLGAKNVNRLLKDVRHIQQYLWEQTFALCLYSRSCYVARDQSLEERARAQDYVQRIRMVAYLEQVSTNITEYEAAILEMLSGGYSHPKIVDWYRQKKNDESEKTEGNDYSAKVWRPAKTEAVQALEEGLAAHAITFTQSKDTHLFSFKQMHLSLNRPLDLFQQLLCLPSPEEVIIKCSKLVLNKCINRKGDPLFRNTESQIFPLTEMDEDTQKTIRENSNEIFENIENAVLEVFEALSEKLLTNPQSNHLHTHFSDQVNLVRTDTDICITINRSYLATVSNFGEFEAFMDALAGSIQTKHHETESTDFPFLYRRQPNKTTDCLESADVLKMMATWQNANSMGIIKRLDQCPSIVASILSFDREHGVGIFDENPIHATEIWEYVERSNNESRSDKVRIISDLITSFLSGSPKKWLFGRSGGRSGDSQTRSLNHFMDKWVPKGENNDQEQSEDRYKRVTELYKKMPNDLIKKPKPSKAVSKKAPKDFIAPRQRIKIQMETRKKNPNAKLPIGSKLAMPFWSAFSADKGNPPKNNRSKGAAN
jgi:hypothetical protein